MPSGMTAPHAALASSPSLLRSNGAPENVLAEPSDRRLRLPPEFALIAIDITQPDLRDLILP